MFTVNNSKKGASKTQLIVRYCGQKNIIKYEQKKINLNYVEILRSFNFYNKKHNRI